MELDERFTLLLALVYFLYTGEYINNELEWNRLVLDLPGSRNPQWEGGDPLFHLAMLEVGQRHRLPELQFYAYKSFVLLFATQQKTQEEAFDCRHINSLCMMNLPKEVTNEETNKSSGVGSHHALETSLSDKYLSDLISAVTTNARFSSMIPILHLLVRALQARKTWPTAPSSILDHSYLHLSGLICFTRLENDKDECIDCGANIQIMSGCKHGWACDESECRSEWWVPTFCTVCLDFDMFYSGQVTGGGVDTPEGNANTA